MTVELYKTLQLTADALETFELRNNAPALRTFVVGFAVEWSFDSEDDDLPEFMYILSDSLDPAIIRESSSARASYPRTSSLLEPLYAFSGLATLCCAMFICFGLDDPALETLSASLPHLRKLHLCRWKGWGDSYETSLVGLASVLRNCPLLLTRRSRATPTSLTMPTCPRRDSAH